MAVFVQGQCDSDLDFDGIIGCGGYMFIFI